MHTIAYHLSRRVVRIHILLFVHRRINVLDIAKGRSLATTTTSSSTNRSHQWSWLDRNSITDRNSTTSILSSDGGSGSVVVGIVDIVIGRLLKSKEGAVEETIRGGGRRHGIRSSGRRCLGHDSIVRMITLVVIPLLILGVIVVRLATAIRGFRMRRIYIYVYMCSWLWRVRL
jgi:hypothetical protein